MSQNLYIDLIKLYKANVAFAPIVQIVMMLQDEAVMEKADFSSMKMFVCTGTNISISLLKKLKEYLPDGMIIISYTMTEAGSGIANIFNPEMENCVGKLSANVSIKILDDKGNQVGVNESGELFVKTPFPFRGYYNDPHATKNAVDDNGWFQTGDVGYFDLDGNLYITGRVNDYIMYMNEKVSSNEIAAFIEKIPGVSLVSVVGISKGATELPTAVIVRTPGSALKKEDVVQRVAENLPDYMQLRGGVYFINFNQMPITSSGKIIRRQVKEIVNKL